MVKYEVIKDEDTGKWLVVNPDLICVYGPTDYESAQAWVRRQQKIDQQEATEG